MWALVVTLMGACDFSRKKVERERERERDWNDMIRDHGEVRD